MSTVFEIGSFLSFLFLIFHVIREMLSFLALLQDPAQIRVWFKKDPQSLLPTLLDEQGGRLRQAIETLGGSFLGIQAEKLPIGGPELHTLAFAFPPLHSFAGIVVLHKSIFTSPSKSVYFLTPFEGGEIVWTTNAPFSDLETDDLSLKAIKGASPQELLDAHIHRMQAYLEKGFHPYNSYTPSSRDEATRMYYRNPSIQGLLRPIYRSQVFLQLGLLVTLLWAFWSILTGD